MTRDGRMRKGRSDVRALLHQVCLSMPGFGPTQGLVSRGKPLGKAAVAALALRWAHGRPGELHSKAMRRHMKGGGVCSSGWRSGSLPA